MTSAVAAAMGVQLPPVGPAENTSEAFCWAWPAPAGMSASTAAAHRARTRDRLMEAVLLGLCFDALGFACRPTHRDSASAGDNGGAIKPNTIRVCRVGVKATIATGGNLRVLSPGIMRRAWSAVKDALGPERCSPLPRRQTMVSRREFLTIGTGGLAAASLTARAWAQAPAQAPKRGGTLSLRTWDPPHFDHILAHAYKTHVVISFTHSRLLKHKAGPSVRPGAFPIEGDLAESWQQTNDTTYVFKLKKGVRFHAKPPVNGRELTAEDVRYTYERILTDKGSVNVSMYRAIAKVEAVDKYTVRFTLKEPFAWFLDMIANPMAGAIIAKECVEKFGDLKKPEAVIGTGPWMLDGYKPNVSITLVRNPTYFVAGLPYIDRVEMFVDEDNASRIAAFLGGKYDLGWEFPGTIQPDGLGADRRGRSRSAAPI